jgi:hypothetical protein
MSDGVEMVNIGVATLFSVTYARGRRKGSVRQPIPSEKLRPQKKLSIQHIMYEKYSMSRLHNSNGSNLRLNFSKNTENTDEKSLEVTHEYCDSA